MQERAKRPAFYFQPIAVKAETADTSAPETVARANSSQSRFKTYFYETLYSIVFHKYV